MNKYKAFVSTCKSVEELNKARIACHALELPKPWSDFCEVEAENLDDAFEQFYDTEQFREFADNHQGTFYGFYLENGAPTLYESDK